MDIHISNLSQNVSDAELRRLFTPFGEVNTAEVVRDKYNGRSKCMATVVMPVDKEARQAIVSLDHTLLDGKAIRVEEVRSTPSW